MNGLKTKGFILKMKNKNNCRKPTHWALSWALTIELGFNDGTYLPRKPALILYPEYFDKYGNPILGLLPIGEEK